MIRTLLAAAAVALGVLTAAPAAADPIGNLEPEDYRYCSQVQQALADAGSSMYVNDCYELVRIGLDYCIGLYDGATIPQLVDFTMQRGGWTREAAAAAVAYAVDNYCPEIVYYHPGVLT